MESNPWQVNSIQAFNCLKCPECMFFSQEELDFKAHAMKNHPMSNSFFNKFESNSFIDPGIKEELSDTISKGNCDLNFSGIKDECLEVNSETVFAENLDHVKEEYLKETNDSKDQNDSDYDPLMSLTISADEAYLYYKKTGLGKQGIKGATFANVKKILEWKNVEIKPRPISDPVLDEKWRSEKHAIVRNFDRIIKKISKGRSKSVISWATITCFFESSKYQTLTYPYSNPEVVSPKIVIQEIVDPEISNSDILNPESDANYQILKP